MDGREAEEEEESDGKCKGSEGGGRHFPPQHSFASVRDSEKTTTNKLNIITKLGSPVILLISLFGFFSVLLANQTPTILSK